MKKIVTFGEIMMRLSTPGYERYSQAREFDINFGGAEANVAVSLASFGFTAEFVTALPCNALGDRCLAELRGFGVHTEHVVRSGERLGIYFLETGAVARPSKVIYDRAHSSFSAISLDDVDWDSVFEDASWFHWTGITPAVSQEAAVVLEKALEVANRLGVTVSCDLNFRKNLWKYGKSASEVMPGLVEKCDIVLANEEDAEKVFGIVPDGGFDVNAGEIEAGRFESVCRKLMERFPHIRKVVMTLRGSINANHNTWGGVLWDGSGLTESRRYDITDIVDRVGGGDSFMAGLIYGLLAYGEDKRALEFAAAASALKHTITGDFNRVSVAEVETLISGNGSGRVSR